MTKNKSTPTNQKVETTREEKSPPDFEVLRANFEKSGCERDSFALATKLMSPEHFLKALEMLPMNLNLHSQNSPETQRIDLSRLDFNGDKETTSHEWAAALVAAKKLKLGAGTTLEVSKVDELIDNAQKIYIQTRKDEAVCRRL